VSEGDGFVDPWTKRGGPADHQARAGDHLTRVAATWGFPGYPALWNHPANKLLREQRKTPHILAVGDTIHVPELLYQEVDRPTEQRHRFRAERHPLELHLAFRSWDGKPLEGTIAEATIDGVPVMFQPGGPGEVTIPVQPLSDRCAVKVGEEVFSLRIGFLQSIDGVAGQRERLNNLGYRAGDADDPKALAFRSAVEEFQCDHGLGVDGVVGPATRSRLAAVHGC
jgi:hypothetical protein